MNATTRTFVAVLCLLATAGAALASELEADLEANKDLVRRFTEAINATDWDALEEIVADDFHRYSASGTGETVTSRDAFIELQKAFLVSMPDQQVTIRQMVAEGDRVAILATYGGTQTGPMGPFPATGKKAEAPFLAILRIESGRIAELWIEWNDLAFLAQLGHVQPPGSEPTE